MNSSKRTINIWMQLLGFDKNDSDRGVARFLERTGFVPDSVCALLCHPDFVNLYRGMDEEYNLFPDNCAYRAVLRNTERYRQDWTNYELRELIANLKSKGVKFYAGIMGVYFDDRFHKEWLSEHGEVRCDTITGKRKLMCLKRLSDGTYYEDFFVEKLVKALVDYDCAGVHFSDNFCPSGLIYKSDYSTDMVEQFISHTGLSLPKEIADTMGDDSTEAVCRRQKYIWGELRREWISFYEWRWEVFFKKICDAVHAVGKEVWMLGMYCTDPFETKYIYGFDTKRVMDAGVDCVTANILPTSVHFEAPGYPYFFHRMHMDLPFLRTQIGDKMAVSMVNLHDASEEWSVIDHAPVRVERDIYTMSAFAAINDGKACPAIDGVFLCLGDGIERQKWDFIKKRLDIGLGTEVESALSPLVLWSDYAHEAMLDEYIKTRRPSPHKQSFEVFKAGGAFAGAIRSECIEGREDVLFVPNYDMLSDAEKDSLARYGGAWVGTAPAAYELEKAVSPSFVCADRYGDRPMNAFLCGCALDEATKAKIEELIATEDLTPSEANIPEKDVTPTIEELPFEKLSAGFLKSVVELLKIAAYSRYPVSCNYPMLAQKLSNGYERLYVYNTHDNAYVTAIVSSEYEIVEAEIGSAFPVLPVKFVNEEDKSGIFDYNKSAKSKKKFQIKLAPDGVTIIDIKRRSF